MSRPPQTNLSAAPPPLVPSGFGEFALAVSCPLTLQTLFTLNRGVVGHPAFFCISLHFPPFPPTSWSYRKKPLILRHPLGESILDSCQASGPHGSSLFKRRRDSTPPIYLMAPWALSRESSIDVSANCSKLSTTLVSYLTLTFSHYPCFSMSVVLVLWVEASHEDVRARHRHELFVFRSFFIFPSVSYLPAFLTAASTFWTSPLKFGSSPTGSLALGRLPSFEISILFIYFNTYLISLSLLIDSGGGLERHPISSQCSDSSSEILSSSAPKT